jgi:hypothetical protein
MTNNIAFSIAEEYHFAKNRERATQTNEDCGYLIFAKQNGES